MSTLLEDHRPKVLLLKPLAYPQIEDECSRHYHLLKAYESPLPIHLFLSSTSASSATALLCSASTYINAGILCLLPSLKLIVTTSVGLNQLDLPECRRRGIAIASPGSIFSDDVADLAVGLLIDVLRNISASDRFVRRGVWGIDGDYPLGKTVEHELVCRAMTRMGLSSNLLHIFLCLFDVLQEWKGGMVTLLAVCFKLHEVVFTSYWLGKLLQNRSAAFILKSGWEREQVHSVSSGLLLHDLRGKRIGIIGLGSIGARVAKRLEAFGCRISYNSRNEKSTILYPYHHNVSELATNCDVLIVCCALTDQTKHLVNKQVLSSLGKEGIVINVGRGAIIDEKILVSFLLEGKIAGAGLDVFENEPDVPQELFTLENVVLSSHRAVLTPESIQGLEELIVGNLAAFFKNKSLLSAVNED